MLIDPDYIIKSAGLIGLSSIIFAESGLFFGFFLPGDTLLFSAGIFASQGYFSLSLLIAAVSVAAILGDSVGYWSGKKIGRKLFEKDASFLFDKKRIKDAERLYEKHGAVTIVIARFIPVIRTFAPIVAGVGKMHYKTFLFFNVVGAVLWSAALTMLGYYFGGIIPNPDKYILPIILAVVILSFLPFVSKILKHFINKLK